MHRRIAALVLALVLLVVAGACSPQEADSFLRTNEIRAARALAPLGWNEGAYAKAVAWSEHMANEGRLSHSELSDGLAGGWRRLGENVAYAGSVEQAMDALEASPGHLANMTNPEFSSVAIGVVERDGRVWVTQVFVG
ncbi:MAG TPA: CAP domain-containing protein [Acidimicrobiales bacterium]|nr:CAP domain-containing protein [Acidimicrobiales bacterium]